MKPAPRLPETVPKDVEEVLEYAQLIESFANSNSSIMTNERLHELSASLDTYCGRLYGSANEVIVSGLHKVIGPPVGDSNEAQHYLTNGISVGRSNGFSVFDVEDWEPDLLEDGEQDVLYANLRERLPGKFAVSHLIINDKRTIVSPDMGLIDNITFNVVAPFRTNDLFVTDLQPGSRESTRREAMAIIRGMDPRSKDYVSKTIENLIKKSRDPLANVIAATPSINSFLADNKGDLHRNALATLVGVHVPQDLFRTVYRAEDLPPVYHEEEDGLSVSRVELPFKQIAFDQLTFLDRYFIGRDSSVISPTEAPPGLFLQATTVISPWGHPLKFHIPAEHLLKQALLFPVAKL